MHMDKVDVYMTPDDFLRAITPGLGPAPNGKNSKLTVLYCVQPPPRFCD